MATLFIVATPIGNLEDITYRAVRTLREVEVIAAEDTRVSKKLFARHEISPSKLLSLFAGNEAARTDELLALLKDGRDVALVSDAGMPGVSDPGQRLVAAAAAAGIDVVVIPGASAVLTALVASGLPTERFSFHGFSPRQKDARREFFGSLRTQQSTMVFFEAPPRVGAALADMVDAFGADRPACLGRELTKLHETLVRESLGELAKRFAEKAPRGECTLVIGGAGEAESREDIDIEARVRALLDQGVSAKDIAARLAIRTGKPRRQLYQLALAMKK